MSLREILKPHRHGLPVKQTQVTPSPPQLHKQQNTVAQCGESKEQISFGEGPKIHLMSSYLEKPPQYISKCKIVTIIMAKREEDHA